MTVEDHEPFGEDAPSPRASAQRALTIAGAVTVVSAGALGLAFQPERAGGMSMLAIIGGTYFVLAALAIARLRARDELRSVMRPARGDLTLGAATAALLYGLATATTMAIAKHGSPREVWIATIYYMLGDPSATSYHVTSTVIFLVAALEEITWRGLVMRVLDEPFRARWAWLGSTLLYGLAHLPTAFLLRNVAAGPNPLLIGGSIGCGFVWGYLANRTRRLLPAIFAHALFTWAIVEFPVWRL